MKLIFKQIPFPKMIYFSFGLFLTGLGLIGVIIPGLPTTIFMILAAACFFRSSTKMYNWVIKHPLFGESVLRFRSGEGMPMKAKYTAIIMMWFFISASIFFFLHSHSLWIKTIITLSGLIGTVFIIKQPTFNKV
jgi:uncharacterized membrane protein YbaN (DUF454 family)